METRMKGLVKSKKGDGFVELQELPVPKIGDNEVLIEVKAAAICGTDLHIYHDAFPYWPPVVLGHEFSGVIVDKGKDVNKWNIGDRVVGEPHTKACGTCWLCRTGNRQLCAEKRSPGWGMDGCFAKYMRYTEPFLLHRIPDDMPFIDASLVEPTANIVTDVLERGGLKPGDNVVVIGPGPIGLLAAMGAKAGGASEVTIIGTERDEKIRLSTARKIREIDNVLNVDREDPADFLLDRTAGKGADLVVEASGSAPGINSAFRLVRKFGTVTSIGLSGKESIPLRYDEAMKKAVNIVCNMSTAYTSWDKAINYIYSGKIDVKPIITHTGALDRWQDFFKLLENQEGLKAVFVND